MAADVDDVVDTLVAALVALLAPYQPNMPPDFVNTATSAGTIPATLIGPGHPIQYPVTTRLENKMSQIVVYDDGKLEKDVGIINEQPDHLPLIGGASQFEVSQSITCLIVEIWSYDSASRRAITKIIRQWIGDFIRLTENDGTTTIHNYVRTVKFDDDQIDSVYVNRMYLMSNYTVAVTDPSYVVETTDLTVDIDDANGNILSTANYIN